ncbi:serine hydrolase [Deinococcus multiflagellatus]|uniref:Serine hydrolase n=1 Tax=Deinococcus multiflagellatus TaxID=1656887 RepID=A0ABW1ZMN2_9DEIO|nr:serine hydrolase [Deinococcus multiflagellatus]MBZ9714090.1 serine hydrolase [Deinococcus multiflagellatus]
MRFLSIVPAALTLSLSGTVDAQAPTPAQAVTRVLSGQAQEADFAPSFLAQVPLATLKAGLENIRRELGSFQRLQDQGGTLRAVFERGELIVSALSLDAQGRIVALRFSSPTPDSVTAQREAVLRALFVTPLDPALFTPEFLQAVPPAQLSALLDSLRAQFGTLQTVALAGEGATLTFSNGKVQVRALALDDQGRIEGLLIAPPRPEVKVTTLDEARAAFAALPGQVSVLVQEVGGPARLSLNAGRPLAVASAFKLAVLGELQAQVQAGRLKWTDEVTLQDADRVFSSAALEKVPAGRRLTLQELAAQMISVSDNTATDLLLRAVGREGVERRLGVRVMVSTREAFILKNPANAELLRDYRAAGLNEQARRAVLARTAALPLPAPETWPDGPQALDVEWFVSAPRLCALMAEVAALPATQLNPGVAQPGTFKTVSYKGGSEPGVLNLTTQVTTAAGRTYCVAATWNHTQALDDDQFIGLYSALLDLLR